MSVSVDTVYQRVLGILNKEQRGYVTPQEFNLFANQAQLDLFEQYFYDINQFGRSTRNSTEYSDMVDLLNKKIAIFEDQATLTYDGVNNYYTLPSDLYRLGTIIYTNSTTKDFYPSPTQIANYPVSNPTVYRKIINESIEAQRVNGNELLYINLSPLTKPKNTLPIYTSKNNKINVYGDEELITGVKCNYIRKPAKVEWKYQMVYGEALYDSTYSQDFELEPSEETELVIKVLELAGLSTKDIQMYQVAAGEEIKNTQQEKA
jgi:hypothetical protein